MINDEDRLARGFVTYFLAVLFYSPLSNTWMAKGQPSMKSQDELPGEEWREFSPLELQELVRRFLRKHVEAMSLGRNHVTLQLIRNIITLAKGDTLYRNREAYRPGNMAAGQEARN
jgi:hypothetical protein